MKKFNNIQQKLQHFIKKYYTNEIIKGSIFFLSFGLLYFIFTLFIEYFLWLKPLPRTILFWVFIIVELGLLAKFIVFPLLKLVGLQKGITPTNASKIIGQHFKEVDDKLLNVLQLKESDYQSELLVASIEQKAKNLKPIPFSNAINFKYNIKYIKYLSIPIIIWLFTFLTGNNSIFTQSFDRVVHHKVSYLPPAPFQFKILNNTLETIEGKPFSLQILTVGTVAPENVKINFNNESHYLSKNQNGEFKFDFDYPVKNIEFYLEANKVLSKDYILEVISTPKIIDFQMELDYPNYTRKSTEFIKNTGNAIIPEGTKITWKVASKNTKEVHFKTNDRTKAKNAKSKNEFSEPFNNLKKGNYILSKTIRNNLDYQINTSNKQLIEYEKLNFSLKTIKDQFPSILIKSDIDSVSRGPVQFIGQLSDDYGLSEVQIVAKNTINRKVIKKNISIGNSDFEEFFYVFPNGFDLLEGVNYEIHFEVFDNDGINGRKKSVSQIFHYNNKSKQEKEEEILKEQKQSINDIENSAIKSEELQKSIEEFSKKLKSKNSTEWNDKKQLNEFLERQKKYQEILQKNTNKLLKNLEEIGKEEDIILEEKKQSLKDRIQENKDLQKQKDLLKELEKMADKLKKEDLLNKIDKLKEQSKQETRSLERILELTKRFYVEKKTAQIIEKLDMLAKEQNNLSEKQNDKNNSKKQQNLNSKFDSIQKDFNELNEQNEELKQPYKLQDTKADEKLIEMNMKKASDYLKKSESNSDGKSEQNAKKNQKSASNKMKELSEKLKESSMQMEMEGSEENIKDLQQIIENLIIFSFDQEELMKSFKGITSKNSQYPEKLKKQILLKEYFEHIDDSLYTLSLRMVRLSSKIQEDISIANYNLDKSLENITDNKVPQGISNQHYTMTAANNLADLLSNMLQNMMNKKPGSGQGKGKKGESVSLPDIIKKQGEMIQKMKDGIKPGQSQGNKSKEQLTGEQFQMYQEQSILKEQLNDLLGKNPGKGKGGKEAIKQMEELEKILLQKGITNESLRRMQKLEYELLKLEKATFDQNKDSKRKSTMGNDIQRRDSIKAIINKNIYFDKEEILIRKNLHFQPLYQNKTKDYFQNN